MKLKFEIVLLIIAFILLSTLAYLELKLKQTGITPIRNPKYYPQYAVGSNNSILLYELKSGFSGLYDGYTVRLPVTNITINSDGFRDREYSVEKPNGTYRIIALGDSFMFGLGVELEAMLNKNSSIKYEVFNFGVPGYNTQQEIEMLKEKGLKYSPDMVIIGYLGNDIEETKIFENIRAKIKKEYQDSGLSETNISYKELDERTNSELNAYYKNITFDKAWQNIAVPLENLRNITLQKNIKVSMLFYNCPNGPFFENQTIKLELLSRKNGWLFINLAEVQGKEEQSRLILNQWDKHPNSYANMLYANYSSEKMKDAGTI